MKQLRIEASDDSPEIILDKDNGAFMIAGKSLPEDVVDFYQPVLDWLEIYVMEPLDKTVFDFKLIYFNTASSKLILDILMILEALQEKGKEVLVRWQALESDEDMQEAGKEYEELVDLEFVHLTFTK